MRRAVSLLAALSIITGSVSPAWASPGTELSKLKDQEYVYRAASSTKRKQAEEAQKKLDKLQTESLKIQQKMDALGVKSAKLKKEIDKDENEIKKKDKALANRLYSSQSTAVSGTGWLNYFLSSDSFGDFISRLGVISEFTSSDQKAINDIKAAKNRLEKKNSSLEKQKDDLQKQQDTLKAQAKEAEKIKNKLKAEGIIIRENTVRNRAAQLRLAESMSVTITGDKTDGYISSTDTSSEGYKVAQKALTRLGAIYVFGACHSMSQISNPSQSVFDCSGLVNWAFCQAGHSIGSQSSSTLVSMGKSVSASEMKPGDILLFSGNGSASGVHHVGIYIGGGKFVHAPNSRSVVKIQDLSESSYYQRQWLCTRRLWNENTDSSKGASS